MSELVMVSRRPGFVYPENHFIADFLGIGIPVPVDKMAIVVTVSSAYRDMKLPNTVDPTVVAELSEAIPRDRILSEVYVSYAPKSIPSDLLGEITSDCIVDWIENDKPKLYAFTHSGVGIREIRSVKFYNNGNMLETLPNFIGRHPGELLDFLTTMHNFTEHDLTHILKWDIDTIRGVMRGGIPVDAAMASILGLVTAYDAKTWLDLQYRYDQKVLDSYATFEPEFHFSNYLERYNVRV